MKFSEPKMKGLQEALESMYTDPNAISPQEALDEEVARVKALVEKKKKNPRNRQPDIIDKSFGFLEKFEAKINHVGERFRGKSDDLPGDFGSYYVELTSDKKAFAFKTHIEREVPGIKVFRDTEYRLGLQVQQGGKTRKVEQSILNAVESGLITIDLSQIEFRPKHGKYSKG